MVLPAINGANTTISHGGLLEVEKTFQTVDQSQKEYELRNKKPNRKSTTVVAQSPTVLAAAGIAAGMIPATLALAVPMMLGRRKRSSNDNLLIDLNNDIYVENYEHQRYK